MDLLNIAAECDPESAAILKEMKSDYDKGLIRDSPRSYADCRDWWDGWLYFYRRCHAHPDDQIWVQEGKVTCVVWIGRDFNDKAIGLLERIAARLGSNNELVEIRLIRTGVSDLGVNKLRTLFPAAKFSLYSQAEYDARPWLAYADPIKAREMFPSSFRSKG